MRMSMYERVVHLQTGGIRVPLHAGAEALAADWPPRQTTPLCATPGCPQYLKTKSINRRVMSREGGTGEGRKEEIKRQGGRTKRKRQRK